ncbi:MarR family transcriptional regulator [Halobacteria archaeon AArc-m2/3/4]|uniref:MarR family transcriptional regulator n=1 Tax=Natronoglomus mannanivorans TaxID=2979990 RepID=A0AAP2YWQ2_9EURY|nr:MarR family transcriptional regulator [Halobacteria archaeon AArc-xg1-1]MCU4973756.1 MarR family transcriptional regulator [Halobacteria archaeon AArc-m2/3/4]
MMQQQLSSKQVTPLPDTLCSPQAKLVYLYLDATDGATVDDLNRTLAMKKIDVLSVLNSLSSSDLVEKTDDQYVTIN